MKYSSSFLFTFFALIALLCASAQLCANDDPPPGVVISQSSDPRTQYLNSPALAILKDGTYVASHGWRWPKTNKYATEIFTSKDRGKTWSHTASLDQVWTNVFENRGELYAIGLTRAWGQLVIRRSRDGGKTWTEPTSQKTGQLSEPKQHHSTTDPMPIINGRIWRSFGIAQNGITTKVISASVDAPDLLDSANWKVSEGFNLPVDYFGGTRDRLFHGSVLPGPDGDLVVMLRVEAAGSHAALLDVSRDGSRLDIDPKKDIFKFPGNAKRSIGRFIVRFDEQTKRYWTVTHKTSDPFARWNVLALMSSKDLRTWKTETVLFHHFDAKYHGIVKFYWQIDGNDIVGVGETMWAMGHGTHLTFHRFKNFRNLTMKDAVPVMGDVVPAKAETRSLILEGNNFEIVPFENNQPAFGNSSYRFRGISNEFNGWTFTRVIAGGDCNIKVSAKRDCEVFFAIGFDEGFADVTGWTPVEGADFTYSKKDSPPFKVFKRKVAANEQIQIPRGTWSGGMVLIPKGD